MSESRQPRRRLRTIRDLDLFEKRVLLRADFNVPFDGDRILDDSRIRAAVPTIRALLSLGTEIRLVTHRGRPGGKVVPELSVAPLAARLQEIVGIPVRVAPGAAGPPVELFLSELTPGDLAMLENVRFEPGEEANDPGFCRLLADLADAYVNDAFGAAHRAHASTEGVAHLLPSAAGLLMEKEVTILSQVLHNPREPLVAIVGGAKISTKIGVMENPLPRVSAMLVGGAMACTLLKADGAEVGDSKVEDDQLDTARRLLEKGGDKLALPVDAVVADAFSADANIKVVDARAVPAGWMMLDIGPRTRAAFTARVEEAGTVVWNGPLGVYEMAPFRAGTEAVARAVAKSPAISIVGGGDLAAAIAQLGLEDSITHVSTGGGATLEFLEGKDLPGIRVLEED
ncbi:MAG: phosphoglycerate kinase [Candidatus Dormibacteraeota bacterium]|nr:phosphoglycerate kinase [Candidatus Dormibacteraeota bacterium]